MHNCGILLRKMIEIVAFGDTLILHSAFCIVHFYRANGAINKNLPFHFGVKGIPETVAYEVKAQHRQHKTHACRDPHEPV